MDCQRRHHKITSQTVRQQHTDVPVVDKGIVFDHEHAVEDHDQRKTANERDEIVGRVLVRPRLELDELVQS